MSESILSGTLEEVFERVRRIRKETPFEPALEETGKVIEVGQGVALVDGLPNVKLGEIIRFPNNRYGLAIHLEERKAGVVLFDSSHALEIGMEAERTERVLKVGVGNEMLGRVVDPLGRSLDNGKAPSFHEMRPIERRAPSLIERLPVVDPLLTGVLAIDSMIPIGRGQRELILGDRQTGKTAIAIDTIINQKDKGVFCIYCAIGKEASEVRRILENFENLGAMSYTAMIAASGKDPPGLNFIAPYAAMALAEFFREQGKDTLLVLDDLTRHAWSYREISLLLRKPPTREAYPGDIFFIHSRLLERAAKLKKELGGGSITALPIIETEEQNISAYIPTNLISITDGQIYLSPQLFQKGRLPAIDVGKSVSRVGGKTQLPLYRRIIKDLRLFYAQYEELESFSRFGSRLDEETKQKIERGKRVREVLKQERLQPVSVAEQIALLNAVTRGLFDRTSLEAIPKRKREIQEILDRKLWEIAKRMNEGEDIPDEEMELFMKTIATVFQDEISRKDQAAD